MYEICCPVPLPKYPEYGRVEVLCHHVDVCALDGDVLGESASSVFKEGPIGLLIVPRGKVASVLAPRFSFRNTGRYHFHPVALLPLF